MQYTRIDIKAPEDLLRGTGNNSKNVYFVRLCGTDAQVTPVIERYYAAARECGVILDKQIKNPEENQLRYFNETLGSGFENREEFFRKQLSVWVPGMSKEKREDLAAGISRELDTLARKGKSDSILKNIYTKIMCWLYYRFMNVYCSTVSDETVRILYLTDGITAHELIMLKLLNSIGADILLLEPAGDEAYLKQDAESRFSQKWETIGKFPPDFCLKDLYKACEKSYMQAARPVQTEAEREKHDPGERSKMNDKGAKTTSADLLSRFPEPGRKACTNAWMEYPELNSILIPQVKRGNDTGFFYNAFMRFTGVPDRISFKSEIYQLCDKLISSGRKVVTVNDELTVPSPDEIETIRRRNYKTGEEAATDLAINLPVVNDKQLQEEIGYAYAQVIRETIRRESNLNRMVVSCVYLLCWIRRYREALFGKKQGNDISCFIYNGGCRNENEAMFMRFLSMLPVDVLIIAPDLNRSCVLQDKTLLDIRNSDTMPVFSISDRQDASAMMTTAALIQSDLDRELYQGTGIFRDRQFSSANTIVLQTTYDELFILWDQELKYRPNFSVSESGKVHMPVLYAKVSGVEKGDIQMYWQKIRQLITPETELITSLPMETSGSYQQLAASVLKDGKIRTRELMNDRRYPMGMLRPEMQKHIWDKAQYMLDTGLIRGTFRNGTEYAVIATILGMNTQWLRRIQNFDFTKKNPKIVCVCTTDKGVSLTDAIMLTFLNLIGFDVVLFVPTGYVTIEKYLNNAAVTEHQAGSYMYDLEVPDIAAMPDRKGLKWFNNLFRRGG